MKGCEYSRLLLKEENVDRRSRVQLEYTSGCPIVNRSQPVLTVRIQYMENIRLKMIDASMHQLFFPVHNSCYLIN